MSKIQALTGNQAASMGAVLSQPDIIAAYPITPQSSVVENLASLAADGTLGSVMVEVESEHAAMSVVQGASIAGARTFTATSAQGLALMYEPYFRMSTLRLPMVMAIAGREMTSPETIWGGQQDSVSVRESGWIQVYVENNQEILDMIIQGYKVAEDPRVLLPVNVCYDGFYLSHLIERVEIPDKELVNKYLPTYNPEHVIFDPQKPMAVDPMTPGDSMMKHRYHHLHSMQNAIDIIDSNDKDFEKIFGRSYGGVIEKYKIDDAEHIIITMGSPTGTAKEAVNKYRELGMKVGLIKIRVLRPFPLKRIIDALSDSVKSIGVVDRAVSFGWNCGAVYQEVLAALGNANINIPIQSFIGGLGGADITVEHMTSVLDAIINIGKSDKNAHKTIWMDDIDGGEYN